MAILLVAVLLCGLAFLLQTAYGKPLSLSLFYFRNSLVDVLDHPEIMSNIRFLDNVGLAFYSGKLNDYSLAGADARREKRARDYATFKSYDAAGLSGQEKISHEIFDYMGRMETEGARWAHHNFPVNQMDGVQSVLPNFMVNIHGVGNESEARDYISRLNLFKEKFEDVLAGLKFREAMGVVPPRVTVEKILIQMQALTAKPAKENLLFLTFKEKLEKIPVDKLSLEKRAQLLEQAEQAVNNSVLPGYRELIAYCETQKPRLSSNDGVWRLPDGDAYYAYQVRMQTTTEMTPAQLHQIGLGEVARLGKELDEILRAKGYATGSLAQRMGQLAKTPEQRYPDTDAGREQVLIDYQQIIDEIKPGLAPYFGVKPKASLQVKRVPPFSEKTTPGAYYDAPSPDSVRPGTFFVNLRKIDEIAKFSMRTTAYHEAIPGHHFQRGLQIELTDLPIFRRYARFIAYIEGWALYAERFAWEGGFEKSPLDSIGRLQAEMLRSVRLVVDTGMHYKRWNREQAITYMMENTGLPEAEVTIEIERYLVMPAQALAYKTGMLKILALRERAKQQLGEKFVLRDFHDVVLKNGATPLSILERLVDAWIAERKAA